MTTLSIPPRFTHQDETVKFMTTQPLTFDMSDAGCVDAKTMFLTPLGWKSISDYVEGDLVAQYDPATKTTTFVKPTHYHKYPCTQFYRVTGSRLDMMLSAEHNVLLVTPHRADTTPFLRSMRVLYEWFNKYNGTNTTPFPAYVPTSTKLTYPEPVTHKFTLPQLAVQMLSVLVGQHPRAALRLQYWYVSPETPAQTQIIEDLIYRKVKSDYVVGSLLPAIFNDKKPLYAFDAQVKDYTKLPNHFYNLRAADYAYLLQILNKWLGSASNDELHFAGLPDTFTNWVLYVGLRRGMSAYKVDDRISFSKYDHTSITDIAVVDHPVGSDGFKYCFTVPTGHLLLQRNGKPFLTGNSGKTRAQIDVLERRPDVDKTLVIAPKSILIPAWRDDFSKFAPHIRVNVAQANNREKAFAADADVYVTNTDAVNWLAKQSDKFLRQFNNIVIDESDAFKHRESQRSKAARRVMSFAKYRALMSATPSDNGVRDLWHQMLLLDGGAALGTNFYRFQSEMYECIPSYTGKFTTWAQKPFAQDVVSELIKAHVVRHKLEECIDIPKLHEYPVYYELSAASQKAYSQMKRLGMTMLENGSIIEGVNAAAVMTKLRQIASGAAYVPMFGDDKVMQSPQLIDSGRYELVVHLALGVPQSLIFFEWGHQKQGIIAELTRRNISHGLIDGSVSSDKRTDYINQFQNGDLRVMLLHPASGAHGITLTNGTREVIASPNPRGSLYRQMVGRIYRAGQRHSTEVITVVGRDTVDEHIYGIQQGKLAEQYQILELLVQYYRGGL